jgi:hypothetical protein
MCKCANGRRLLRSYKTNLRENVQMCKWSPFVAQL